MRLRKIEAKTSKMKARARKRADNIRKEEAMERKKGRRSAITQEQRSTDKLFPTNSSPYLLHGHNTD